MRIRKEPGRVREILRIQGSGMVLTEGGGSAVVSLAEGLADGRARMDGLGHTLGLTKKWDWRLVSGYKRWIIFTQSL